MNDGDEAKRIATVLKEGLIPTSHPNVFYKSKNDRYDRGELAFSLAVAKEFPKYTVIITMGPWRGYTVRYEVSHIEKTIRLDFYSPGWPYEIHQSGIIEEIRQYTQKHDPEDNYIEKGQ